MAGWDGDLADAAPESQAQRAAPVTAGVDVLKILSACGQYASHPDTAVACQRVCVAQIHHAITRFASEVLGTGHLAQQHACFPYLSCMY